MRIKYRDAPLQFQAQGSLHYTQYVQPLILSHIIHLCAQNLAIGFYQRINLKWILGEAQRGMREVSEVERS